MQNLKQPETYYITDFFFFFFFLNKTTALTSTFSIVDDVITNVTVPFNNTRTLKFKAQLAIWFYAAVNHYRNRHLKAETNRMDRNPPITAQEHDL